MAAVWTLRSEGASTQPRRMAIFRITGVKISVVPKLKRKIKAIAAIFYSHLILKWIVHQIRKVQSVGVPDVFAE
jgi:hypothetical protein